MSISTNEFWQRLKTIVDLPEHCVECHIRMRVGKPVEVECILLVAAADPKDQPTVKTQRYVLHPMEPVAVERNAC